MKIHQKGAELINVARGQHDDDKGSFRDCDNVPQNHTKQGC